MIVYDGVMTQHLAEFNELQSIGRCYKAALNTNNTW